MGTRPQQQFTSTTQPPTPGISLATRQLIDMTVLLQSSQPINKMMVVGGSTGFLIDFIDEVEIANIALKIPNHDQMKRNLRSMKG